MNEGWTKDPGRRY